MLSPTLFIAAYWLVAAALQGYCEGRLMPTLRAVPPGPTADKNSRALHLGFTACYFLPLLLPAPVAWWVPPVLAVLARVALFDVALNLSEGRPALSVGFTAAYDRALRRLAPERPEVLAGVGKAGAVVGVAWVIIASAP